MAVAKFLEGNWKYKSTEMQKKNGFVIWSLHNSYQWIQNCYFKNQNSKLFESIDIIKLFEFFIFYLFLFFFQKNFQALPMPREIPTISIVMISMLLKHLIRIQKYQRKKAKSCEEPVFLNNFQFLFDIFLNFLKYSSIFYFPRTISCSEVCSYKVAASIHHK